MTLGHGSQLLRDLSVCLLALAVASPLIVLWPRLCAGAALLWLLLFLTPLPRRLLGALARGPAAGPGPVVVLAGGFAADGALSRRTLRRLHHGAALARGRELILCGGAVSGSRTEAEAMARELRESGYDGPLRLEACSRTTFENIAALSRLGSGLIVVTCPQHRPRVVRLGRLLGAELCVVAYPAEHLPLGLTARLRLAVECFYELAIHLWLLVREGLAGLGLRPPLHMLRWGP